MTGAVPRVQLHILDPIPAVVVTKVLDGLRARGLAADLLGTGTRRHPAASRSEPHVFLTSHPEATEELEHDAAVVTLPPTSRTRRFDRAVADRVLEQVVEELHRVAPAV